LINITIDKVGSKKVLKQEKRFAKAKPQVRRASATPAHAAKRNVRPLRPPSLKTRRGLKIAILQGGQQKYSEMYTDIH
jgi:hypothetical protein